MNAASVMAVFKVRLSFSGMIFETDLSLHFTGLQLSGDRGTVFTFYWFPSLNLCVIGLAV